MQLDSPPRNGACIGKPVDWFYPDPRGRGITRDTRLALQICESCAVKDDCGNYALKWELHGIWGGMTERERHVIRNRLGIMLEIPGHHDPILTRTRK